MNPTFLVELEARREAIVWLCQKYGVAALDLFGSAATAMWRSEGSDLDFLVRFQKDGSSGVAVRYLRLAEELEALFGRPVDLVTEDSIRNPYFRRNVEATRTALYAA